MTSVHDLSNLLNIDGIKNYYLVKYDGSGLAAHGAKADAVFPFVAFAGLNSDLIRSLFRFSKFNHMILSRQCQEDVIIFSVKNHFLAVIKNSRGQTPDIIEKVYAFLQETIAKN